MVPFNGFLYRARVSAARDGNFDGGADLAEHSMVDPLAFLKAKRPCGFTSCDRNLRVSNEDNPRIAGATTKAAS